MEPLAREYADRGFSSLFVYTREAHPGENYPAHRSLEQKLAHARAFRELSGAERPIMVDDLLGHGHKLYGTLPNMTYLIGRGGTVLFRADWTDPPTLRQAMDYLIASRERRREELRLGPFYAEFVGYRWSNAAKFQEGLARAGQQAVQDSAEAMRKQASAEPRPGRIVLQE